MGLLRTLHAWAGAVLSLVLLVLGLSGSLLVLREPWVKLTVPEARAEAAPTPQALGAALEALEAQAPGELRNVVFAGPHLGVHRLYFTDKAHGYAAADGAVLARWPGVERVETFVFELHHRLLAGETGDLVVGVAGLAGALLAITGVIVWAPAWRSFAGRIWPRRLGRRADLVSAHRDLGLITAIPVCVLCLTGGAIIFHETSQALLKAAAPGGVAAPRPPVAGTGDVDWPRALAAAQGAFPEAVLRMAATPAKPGAPVTIRMRRPGEWHPNGRTVVYVDPADERVLAVVDAQALGPGLRAYNSFYPLHAGAIGGFAWEAAVFLSGLALAALGGFGLWSFLLRQAATARRWAASLPAAAE